MTGQKEFFGQLVLLLFISLLLSGCESTPAEDTTAVDNDRRVNVITEVLTPVNLTETFTLPARIQAREDLTLSAEIAGVVTQTHVIEGMNVVRGQKLLEIDSAIIRSQLEREKQNVEVLSRRYERLRKLEQEGLVSRQELDDVANGLTAAQSGLRQAQIQLDKSSLQAPISGIVDRRYVDSGEYVDTGKSLLRLVRVDQLEVVADIPEKDVAFLQPGQEVTIVPASIHGFDLKESGAVIEHISFVADDNSRTYRTTMLIDNPTPELRPGMIVRATFVRQEHQQVLAVPLFAVLDRRGKKIVFVVEDDLAREVEVTTGSSIGRQLIVRFGLKAGQQLVVKGHQMLIDGALVRVGSK